MLNGALERFRPVNYVIMDLDGTLLDTESIMAKIFNEYLKQFKITFNDELKKRFMGVTPKDQLAILRSEFNVKYSLERYIKDLDKFQEKYMRSIQLMPGVETLVNWFVDHDIPIAIATSSSRKDVQRRTQDHSNIFHKFHHITTRNDYERGKPYPDCFMICASRFVHPALPKQVLVFEDSMSGVEAARSAGMQVILVGDSIYTSAQKRRATKSISNLCDFDPNQFDLP